MPGAAAPPTPPGWSLDAAKAFMVIAVAAVDGRFDPDELAAIAPALGGVGLSAADAGAAVSVALRHYRDTIAADTLADALAACARELKEALSPADRRAFMRQLLGTALADDRYRPGEHEFLRMIGAQWEI